MSKPPRCLRRNGGYGLPLALRSCVANWNSERQQARHFNNVRAPPMPTEVDRKGDADCITTAFELTPPLTAAPAKAEPCTALVSIFATR